MNQVTVRGRIRGHWTLWLLVGAAASFVVYLAGSCLGVLHDASEQQMDRSDAIVVFGAAQYYGRPSPVYKARLDHAFALYQSQVAPVVITTGGSGADVKFNEGGVGHDYLMRRGIPDQNLIAETQSSDTAASAERIAVIMRRNHMDTCTAVSDEYHVFRIRKLLEHEGMKVYVAPRPDSRPKSAWQKMLAVNREALSYIAWRLSPA
jgi:uncharacterized SAM-binding protein YcdF (DUF218 family)